MQITFDTKHDTAEDFLTAIRFLKTGLNAQYGPIEISGDVKLDLGREPSAPISGTDVHFTAHNTLDASQPTASEPEPQAFSIEALSEYLSQKFPSRWFQLSIEQVQMTSGVQSLLTVRVSASDITLFNDAMHEFAEQHGGVPQYSVTAVKTAPARLPDVNSTNTDPDIDSAGQKWDATIHSESHAKNADGTWRRRRNTKGVVSSQPAAVPAPPAAPIVNLHGDLAKTPAVPAPPAAVPAPPATVPAPPVAVTQVVPVNTFRELMEKVTEHMAARRIDSKRLQDICRKHGIESLQDCFTNTALIPVVHAAIESEAAVVGGAP